MSHVRIRAWRLVWKGFHNVIKRGELFSAYTWADDFGRRNAEEGRLHRSCRGDDTDCDQSWRRDTLRLGPAALESDAHLLRSLLRSLLRGRLGEAIAGKRAQWRRYERSRGWAEWGEEQ